MAVQTPVNQAAAPAIPGINRARDSFSTEDSSSAPSHLSISLASSSGLDGSLAGFSLFANPARPGEGAQSEQQQRQQEQHQQPPGGMTRTVTHRVLPTNGLFGSAAFAARAAAAGPSGARHDTSLSNSLTTGGESSLSVDASFPNRLQPGSNPPPPRWGGSSLHARFTTDMAPPPIPSSSTRTPAVSSDAEPGPSTPTRVHHHNAQYGSSSTQRGDCGLPAPAPRTHHDPTAPSSTLSQTEATFSQTAGGDSADGPQSQRYPTNSTSAESSVEYAVQLLQAQGLLPPQSPGGGHVLPSSTPALPAFLTREPSARSLAASRDQRMKAHVQIGLAISSHRAPPLDPSVYSSKSGLTPFPVLTSSGCSQGGLGRGINASGTESHPMLGIPLPSPEETASLRHRAYLAQRQNMLRDNLARANVLIELDHMAQEQDRDELRARIEENAALWRADRERARRQLPSSKRHDGEGNTVGDASRSTASGNGLGDSTASNQSKSGGTGGYPSAMSSAQQVSMRTLLRSSPGPDGKAASSMTRLNAVAMLTNEGRNSLQYLAAEIAQSQPLVAEWACALPPPGAYNAPLIAAQRVRRSGTSAPTAPPEPSSPSRARPQRESGRAGGNKEAMEADKEEVEEEEGPGLRLSTTFLISGQALSSETVTASAAIASNKSLFTARQTGAEIGTMASTWDVGPSGKRLRGVHELERCGWAADEHASLVVANAVCWGGARRR
ncbi:hypothetical protein OC861_003360 [Tilletia horrida]|nr:hypothetical protein OC861_003360 [Tilletia horrida]